MSTDNMLDEVADGCARITLNRPERRNALYCDMVIGPDDATSGVS